MSILNTLKSWEHTFTGWVAKQYASFRKMEPSLVAMGDRVYPYVKSSLQIALSFESPAVAAAAGSILDKIHAGMDTAAALLYDYGPHPDVVSALQTTQNDLASLESLAGIKSDDAKNAIQKALTSFQAFVASVMGAAGAIKAPVANPVPVTPPVTGQ